MSQALPGGLVKKIKLFYWCGLTTLFCNMSSVLLCSVMYCYATCVLLYTVMCTSGISEGSVYQYLHVKTLSELQNDIWNVKGEYPLYYKTHYPFMRNFGEADGYLSTHPHKVVVVIRNPLDAAFSEYIR